MNLRTMAAALALQACASAVPAARPTEPITQPAAAMPAPVAAEQAAAHDDIARTVAEEGGDGDPNAKAIRVIVDGLVEKGWDVKARPAELVSVTQGGDGSMRIEYKLSGDPLTTYVTTPITQTVLIKVGGDGIAYMIVVNGMSMVTNCALGDWKNSCVTSWIESATMDAEELLRLPPGDGLIGVFARKQSVDPDVKK